MPTCRNFYNIYHPLDFIAYRLEPLIKKITYEKTSDGIIRSNIDLASTDMLLEEIAPLAVLIPYYKNHGLNPSQKTLKFMNDQQDLYTAMLTGQDLPKPVKHK